MTVAIRPGTLIDSTGADPRPNAVVLVDDGVITGIASDVPTGATVIDASELTCCPASSTATCTVER
ncbi:MAG: hypothetical protein NVS9B6_15790 [Candidatus Limnocylindrales bacterium]